ncbi:MULTISPECIES: DUF2797 domain-containing protein [Haloferacaceae]|uniref:DUF2797 domain-containing protein n=1 Tax=Halorubrum glutamatedens TaxID=2707018 RepID=A0ABD5QSF5_9EURY|nr:DUF2797 domain-containing protein [Halobellus captivus]
MQVVGYETGASGDGDDGEATGSDAVGGGPAPVGGGFYVADGGEVEYVAADPGSELSFGLGDRRCAGTVHEGSHVACDADAAPYCEAHSDVWVCARCTGTCLKDEMDCHEEHAMYLAAFAPDTFKVGVTRLWRLGTRLREQGADRAAHVRTFPDGRVAREVEAELASGGGLVDRVRVPTKVDGFGREVDAGAWEELVDRFEPIERFDFDYGLDLTDRPVAETMAAGTVRGWKGRVLVLDRNGSTYAVDARELVGHELTEEVPDRDLQSSLGAFGG